VPAQRLDISLADGNTVVLKRSAGRDTSTVMERSRNASLQILRLLRRGVEKAALGKSTEMANLQLGTCFRKNVVESRSRECAFVGDAF
jgi:hypothetical protein